MRGAAGMVVPFVALLGAIAAGTAGAAAADAGGEALPATAGGAIAAEGAAEGTAAEDTAAEGTREAVPWRTGGDWRDDPTRAATTTPLSAAAADAGAAAIPDLESMPFARPRWPPPTPAEFEAAPVVLLARVDLAAGDFGDSSGCSARTTRGWLRVDCKLFEPSVQVLGGSADGVLFETTEHDAVVTMALSPGDRRVLQLSSVGQGYEGGGLIVAGILSESWVGTEGPHVTIA